MTEQGVHVFRQLRAELAVRVLDSAAAVWPSPMREQRARLGVDPGTPEHDLAYAKDQFTQRVRSGLTPSLPQDGVVGRRVLEVGCGHGGISCFLACTGAREVVGIDLNEKHLAIARDLAAELAREAGRSRLPVEFCLMDASRLSLADASFDVVLADNLMEHVTVPEQVLAEARRVLKPGGFMLIPNFSSIYSKYGLHLKHGIKMPWANLVFSETTIVRALQRRARHRPELYEIYPGLRHHPSRVRDVRRHRDLNDITHRSFIEMANRAGFEVASFQVKPTGLGRVVRKLVQRAETSRALDVLSTGASAVLVAR